MRNLSRVFALWLTLLAGAALAQEHDGPSYEQWSSLAERTQTVLTEGGASNEALEQLRSRVSTWRDEFHAAQSVNKDTIATLEGQISALGPVPTDDSEEDPVIAQRRSKLTAQLVELRAPVLRAEEAYQQSSGLISQLDRTLREREAARLLSRGPSPLLPGTWSGVEGAVSGIFERLKSETAALWRDPSAREARLDHLPLALLFSVLGSVVIWRGRAFVELIGQRARRATRRGTGVWDFIISFGQIFVPMSGALMVFVSIGVLNVLGDLGQGMALVVLLGVAVVLGYAWLGRRLFPPQHPEEALLPIEQAAQPKLRSTLTMLGAMVTAHMLLSTLGTVEGWPAAPVATLGLPLILLSAFGLWRLARGLRQLRPIEPVDGVAPEPGFRARLLSILSLVLKAVAIVAPVLAMAGYGNAAQALIYPAVQTVALFGGLVVIHNFAGDLYSLVTGREEGAHDALIPTLLGFLMLLCAVPLLALTWGARATDLGELWQSFLSGFSVGKTQISPMVFLTFVIIFIVGYMVTRLLQLGLRTSMLPKTRLDPGAQTAIVSGVGYLGVFLAALIAITTAGIDLSSLAIVAGALSVGIGFGLQNVVSNFVSGIILLIERPVSEGDWIDVGGHQGIVRAISVRSTRIETFDRQDVIVPNADLVSGVVTNWTRGSTIGRIAVPVGVAYGTDTRRVEAILKEIVEAHPMVLMRPPPSVLFQGFGADSLDFEIRAILRDVSFSLSAASDMRHEIIARFTQEGIEVPFAQRDIWIRNPEAFGKGEETPS